jgi:RNA:NAD 2'-phosphotransferase (TPT1/KptA family)
MADLLNYLGSKTSIDLVHSIVENNDKKRYEIKIEDGVEYIRAA